MDCLSSEDLTRRRISLIIYVTRNSHTRQLAKLDKLPVVIRRDLILRWTERRQTDASPLPTMRRRLRLQKRQLHVPAIVWPALGTTEFLSTWLSSRMAKLRIRSVTYFDRCRRKRNVIYYDNALLLPKRRPWKF